MMRRPSSSGAEGAGRPRVDLHLVEVGDAPSAYGLLPGGIGAQGDGGSVRVVEEQGRAGPLPLGPTDDLCLGQRNDRLYRSAIRPGNQDDPDPPENGVAGREGLDGRLARLVNSDQRDAGVLGELACGPYRLYRRLDLVLSQRVERMRNRLGRRLGPRCRGHDRPARIAANRSSRPAMSSGGWRRWGRWALPSAARAPTTRPALVLSSRISVLSLTRPSAGRGHAPPGQRRRPAQ